MKSLIDRNVLIAEYDRLHIGKPGKARQLMEDAPEVDAVPVIRCKDCVHYQRWITGMYCTVHDWRSKKNDYCSRAEKLK